MTFQTPTEATVRHLIDSAGNSVDLSALEALNGMLSAKDAGPAWTTIRGVDGEPVTSADMSAAAVAVIDAPDTGEKLVIDDLWLSTAEELSFTLTEETTGTVILGPLYMAANSTQQITPRGRLKLDTADSQLMCQTSAAGAVSVLVLGHSEA